jgi:hypothetical protein
MPILSMFYGIIIRMYYADNKQPHVPHIHAEFGNYKAVFSISDRKLLAGKFPRERLVSCSRGLKSVVKN